MQTATTLRAIFDKTHKQFIDTLKATYSLDVECVESYDVIRDTLDIKKLIARPISCLDLNDFTNLKILPNKNASDMYRMITSVKSINTFFTYLMIFGVLITKIELETEKDGEVIDKEFIEAFTLACKGKQYTYGDNDERKCSESDEDEDEDEYNCEDVINVLLSNIKQLKSPNETEHVDTDNAKYCKGEETDETPFDMSFIENSKIGKLAQEISSEIDFSNIKSADDISKFFDPKNNFIGDIVGKVGSKITDKLNNGDLKQDDLLSDAFGLMNSLGGKIPGGGNMADILNNPMMKNIMQSMSKSMGGEKNSKVSLNNNKMRTMSTRERLKNKLKERKNT